jgi:methionyl aminopeptidase
VILTVTNQYSYNTIVTLKAAPRLLSEDILQKYRLAGRIASEVRNSSRQFVRAGVPIIDICEGVEKLIRDKGGEWAFPCNVCINEVAAHYTSPPLDQLVVPPNSMVKVDLGVHIDGYIADTATTICLDKRYENMYTTAQRALQAAIDTLQSGVKTPKIGSAIQRTIESQGFKPISNLTGHQLAQHIIHSGKSIPNIEQSNGHKLEEGEVYAIEPFVTTTDATGEVRNGKSFHIFRFLRDRKPKGIEAKVLLRKIWSSYRTLPFSERWLYSGVTKGPKNAFLEVLASKSVMYYPVLVEASGCLVAQAEHTVLITNDGCEVLTL